MIKINWIESEQSLVVVLSPVCPIINILRILWDRFKNPLHYLKNTVGIVWKKADDDIEVVIAHIQDGNNSSVVAGWLMACSVKAKTADLDVVPGVPANRPKWQRLHACAGPPPSAASALCVPVWWRVGGKGRDRWSKDRRVGYVRRMYNIKRRTAIPGKREELFFFF